VPLGELSEHVYVHYEDSAVQHLFSVTCGLDSMVVGEGQILGQVRDALKEGQKNGSVGRVLNDLGQRALHVGKRAHTETHLDHAGADMVSFGLDNAVQNLATAPGASIPGASLDSKATPPAGCPMSGTAVSSSTDLQEASHEVSLPETGPLTGTRALILGAGSMSALSAHTVARQGAGRVVVANRTFERAARLAECPTEAYDSLQAQAVAVDEATAAPTAPSTAPHAWPRASPRPTTPSRPKRSPSTRPPTSSPTSTSSSPAQVPKALS